MGRTCFSKNSTPSGVGVAASAADATGAARRAQRMGRVSRITCKGGLRGFYPGGWYVVDGKRVYGRRRDDSSGETCSGWIGAGLLERPVGCWECEHVPFTLNHLRGMETIMD